MGMTRTYRAGTMREALAQVRRDLGGGAVILGTREVRRRRLFGLGSRELIEVTATDGRAAPVSVSMPMAMSASMPPAAPAPATSDPAPPALSARVGEPL